MKIKSKGKVLRTFFYAFVLLSLSFSHSLVYIRRFLSVSFRIICSILLPFYSNSFLRCFILSYMLILIEIMNEKKNSNFRTIILSRCMCVCVCVTKRERKEAVFGSPSFPFSHTWIWNFPWILFLAGYRHFSFTFMNELTDYSDYPLFHIYFSDLPVLLMFCRLSRCYLKYH